MFTKRTVIGTVVGGGIISIGMIALVMSIGLQTVHIDDALLPGEATSYRFAAPAQSSQSVLISGDAFDAALSSPGGGLQVPDTRYRERATFEWSHESDGESRMEVRNAGQSEIRITGTVQISTDPIYYTYHVLVIISGIVIVGFSAGFSVRKPRGF